MSIPGTSRVNGTYHAADAQKVRLRRTRLLIAVGGLLAALGLLNVVLINNDMTRIESAGPAQLAQAGGGIAHFVPSILTQLRSAQRPANTVTAVDPTDPRHSVPFVNDKRALERWTAFTGLSLAVLFIGLESRIPNSTAREASPTGSDLSRLMILLALSYAALSIFENG